MSIFRKTFFSILFILCLSIACQRAYLPLCNEVSNIFILQHQTLSAILQDIEEKQENLLEFEIRNPEDAGKYRLILKYDIFRYPRSSSS